jgi:large subunit ribosomal protein L28
LLFNNNWVISQKKLPFKPKNQKCLHTFAVQKISIMARVCQVTGKKPITGNKVSHSNIKTKRRFLPNLQTKRYFLAEEDKWVTLKVSSEAIRTINKNGLLSVVKGLRAAGEKI